jgi:hypothetical protein
VSSIKSIVKKIPTWAKVLFPIALVLLALYWLRDRGRGVWPWATSPPSSDGPAAPPAITPKEAEKAREEIKEELKVEEEKVTSEADALRKKIEEKFGPRPEG